jgi:hypothetical protein
MHDEKVMSHAAPRSVLRSQKCRKRLLSLAQQKAIMALAGASAQALSLELWVARLDWSGNGESSGAPPRREGSGGGGHGAALGIFQCRVLLPTFCPLRCVWVSETV